MKSDNKKCVVEEVLLRTFCFLRPWMTFATAFLKIWGQEGCHKTDIRNAVIIVSSRLEGVVSYDNLSE